MTTRTRRSGLLGLSDLSADTRELVAARGAGDEDAALALASFARETRAVVATSKRTA